MFKKIFQILIFLLVSYLSYSQQTPETTALNRFVINRHDTIYVFYAKEPDRIIKTLPGRYYYWYGRDTILMTEEGYNNRVLDGTYNVYYPNSNLKEQGTFSKGLKTGLWKYWQPDGSLEMIEKWNRGERKSIKRKAKPKLAG